MISDQAVGLAGRVISDTPERHPARAGHCSFALPAARSPRSPGTGKTRKLTGGFIQM